MWHGTELIPQLGLDFPPSQLSSPAEWEPRFPQWGVCLPLGDTEEWEWWFPSQNSNELQGGRGDPDSLLFSRTAR